MKYRSPHVDFIFEEGSTDYLIVTFNPINIRADGKRFWGDSFFRDNGVSVLGIVSTRRNWFPWEGMEKLLEEAGPILKRYGHICAYGSSMGAYGAIKYSRAIGAQTVVAFSPQHSINPAHEKYPSQFSAYYNEKLHQDVAIQEKDLGGTIFVFYDPFHLVDGHAADCIAGLSDRVKRVPVPFIGHTTILPFTKNRKGMEVLRLCMAGEVEPLHALSRAVRKKSWLRAHNLACALVPRHVKWAFAIYDKYPEALDEQNLDNFCKVLKLAGQTAVAIEWLQQFVTKHPLDARAFKKLAIFLMAAGRYRQAKDVMSYAIRLEPENHRSMLILSMIFTRDGKLPKAIQWAEKAKEAGPGDPGTFKYHAYLLRRSGFPERSAEVLQAGALRHPGHPYFIPQVDGDEESSMENVLEGVENEERLARPAPRAGKKKAVPVEKAKPFSRAGSLARFKRFFERVFGPKSPPGRE